MPSKHKSAKSNSRRSHTRGPPTQRFQDIVSRELTTLTTTYQNSSTFSTSTLLPSLNVTTHKRTVRIRRINCQFGPTEITSPGTQTAVQLAAVDLATQVVVPMTRMMTLSEVNPRSLSFSLPAQFSRWLLSNDDTTLFQITIFNISSSATVVPFSVRITSSVDMAPADPTPV
jgi:hypothetical protein